MIKKFASTLFHRSPSITRPILSMLILSIIGIAQTYSQTIKTIVYVDGKESLFTAYITDEDAKIASITGHPDFQISTLEIPSEVTLYREVEGVPSSRTLLGTYTIESIDDYAFRNKMIGKVIIPGTVKRIGNSAFNACSSLSEIVFGEGVESIGDEAFRWCPINSLNLPKRLKSIGESAFAQRLIADYGGNLQEVIIPDSVEEIGGAAFDFCYNIKKLVLGSSLKTIGSSAFSESRYLESVIVRSTEPPVVFENTFYKAISKSTSLFVPDGTFLFYLDKSPWNKFTIVDALKPTTFVTEIDGELYDNLFDDGLTITAGQSVELKVSTNPNIENLKLLWYCSNLGVAYADGSISHPYEHTARISAYREGTATIQITANAIDLVKSFELNVLPKPIVYPENITLSTSNLDLNEGESSTITATLLPEDTTDKTLVWTSSNEAVATVDQFGLVTAVSQGSAVITVSTTDGSNVSAICNITVRKLVSDIVLNETEATLNEGQTVQLTATVSPELADNKTLQWTSSDDSVATVNQSGLVTAVSHGTAIITAITTDGSEISATCTITVRSSVVAISLSETEIEMSAGEYRILTAQVFPPDATATSLIWSSSNENVARVENGIVIAVANGEATVTVSSSDNPDIFASCHIVVTTLVSEIILSESNITLKEGEFKEISATILPNDATYREVAWSSSNQSVATVLDGIILAHKQGSAVIRVEATDDSGVYAECFVQVTNDTGIAYVADNGISISTAPLIATISGINNGTIIRLFDTNGKMLYLGNGPRVEVSQSGIYILIVDNKTFKIKL